MRVSFAVLAFASAHPVAPAFAGARRNLASSSGRQGRQVRHGGHQNAALRNRIKRLRTDRLPED